MGDGCVGETSSPPPTSRASQLCVSSFEKPFSSSVARRAALLILAPAMLMIGMERAEHQHGGAQSKEADVAERRL